MIDWISNRWPFSFRLSGRRLLFGVVGMLVLSALGAPCLEPEPPEGDEGGEWVILVHGLARRGATMEKMAEGLREEGYRTLILDYPSRHFTVRDLADGHLAKAVTACRAKKAEKIHWVTHSLGGILVRDYLARYELDELGRVVMLAPPNGGSEVVDCIGHWKLFQAINGPAGTELGTGDEGVAKRLKAVDFPLGVIAGDRSINPINSCMIPGADDGKVSVEHTKVEGMKEHQVLHCTHPMIMKRDDVIVMTRRFLRHGTFHADAE